MSSDYWNNWYKRNKGRFLSLINEHKKNRRMEMKELIEKKKGFPCVVCNKKFPPEAMDFYHRDNDDKRFRIGDAANSIYSLEKLEEEISKCDLYCGNCRKAVEIEGVINKSPKRKRTLRGIINTLKALPCSDCGDSFPYYCMEFDHLEGNDKGGTIAKMVSDNQPFDKIKDEIDKSEVVCINCHRIRTKKRRDV